MGDVLSHVLSFSFRLCCHVLSLKASAVGGLRGAHLAVVDGSRLGRGCHRDSGAGASRRLVETHDLLLLACEGTRRDLDLLCRVPDHVG